MEGGECCDVVGCGGLRAGREKEADGGEVSDGRRSVERGGGGGGRVEGGAGLEQDAADVDVATSCSVDDGGVPAGVEGVDGGASLDEEENEQKLVAGG